MKQKTNQTLFNYWNKVRDQRLAPRRFEIEPSQIAAILPSTFILERIDSETFRFRLAGTAICDAFGQDFRDSNFLSGWSESDRISLERHLSVVTLHGGVGVLDIDVSNESDVAAARAGDGSYVVQARSLRFEVVLLPLLHTRDVVDRVLGAMTPTSTPDWLGHDVLSVRSLAQASIVWPDGVAPSVADSIMRQEPFAPHVRKARIVRSDRRQFRVYDGGLHKSHDE
jgi:hypothetical protein